jgi:pimeloyl-ACP methyl ester carboxylesterase
MTHLIEVERGVKLFVQDWGTGKPVVFISGWPFDHRSYEYQFNQLPETGLRCIGIDMRGYGKSDKPWSSYSYDIFADDVHKVLQHLNLKDVLLVGHSMGGAISFHYVAKYGNTHVSKLMLCGAAAPIFTQRPNYPYGMTQEEVDEFIDLCDKDRAKLLTNFGTIFFYKSNSLTPELVHWFWLTGMQASPYATKMCLKLLRDADLRADLAKITIPTLIAHGITDKVCSYDFAKVLHEHIADSRLVTFEKSGHGLFYDEREKFNKTIIDFVKQ